MGQTTGEKHQRGGGKRQAIDEGVKQVRPPTSPTLYSPSPSRLAPPLTPKNQSKMLDRALEEGDEVAEKKARRAILRQAARERVHVREKAARVLADQRRLEQKNSTGYDFLLLVHCHR